MDENKETSKKQTARVRAAQRSIELIRAQLARVEVIASGSLRHIMKSCGRPTCKCVRDPTERHGPYHEWSHRQDGRQVNRSVSPDEADILKKAIGNRRRIEELLKQLESASAIVMGVDDSSRSRRRALPKRSKK
jgi:hypothetical protein